MNNLKRIRTRMKMTQAQICIRSGLHPSTLSRIERGIIQGGNDHRRRISRALGVAEAEIWPDKSQH